MENAKEAIKCMENVVLPFTLSSMTEFVTKMHHLFLFMLRFDDNTIEEQNEIANWLIQSHVFKTMREFLVKVIESYPALFTSEFGDKVQYDVSQFYGDVTNETIPTLLLHACCHSMESLINVTDKFESAQKACCSDGLVQLLVTDMFPLLLDVTWGAYTIREELLNRSLDLVYNCCKVPSNHIYYEEANAVDALLKIREKTKEHQNEADITALLALGYLLDDSNNDQIISGQGTIKLILEYVTYSLKNAHHVYFGYHLEEFLTGLSHLAVKDENKDLICDEGGIPVLAEVLKNSHDDKELIACCNALSLLCFCNKGSLLIDENEDLKDSLFDLEESKNVEVQKNASGVLWQLKKMEKKIHEVEELEEEHECNSSAARSDVNANTFDNATNQHIMISYQWDNQQMAKRIADYLKGRGFKVWIDIYDMKGYIMDDMATAVENSAILIVCLSRSYKNSPNTRRECDYAFELRKDFIPLMMEENYKPDGWLGILLGTKLWTDFTNQSMFDSKMEELCSRLGSVTKTVEPLISPMYETTLTAKRKMTDGHFHGQHHPVQQHDVTDNGAMSRSSQRQLGHTEMTNQILGWGNNEVTAWLRNKGITKCIKKTVLKKIDGLHLTMLYKLQKTNPIIYYQTAMQQIGDGNFLDVLTFSHHLEALFETLPTR